MSMNLNENASVLFEKLENFFTSKTVVGETIQVGDVTLIPLMNISFGLGLGGGDGVDEKGNKGMGGGSGVGAKAVPTAILVVKNGNVEVMPVNNRHGLEKLVAMVPEILEKVDFSHCCTGEKRETDTPEESQE